MDGEKAKVGAEGEVKEDIPAPAPEPSEKSEFTTETGGGWGGWGFSSFSYLSDLQKAAAVAAEEISRNAASVAKSFADVQDESEGSESSKDDDHVKDESAKEEEVETEEDKRRKATLEKLETASEDTFLGQGLKAFDSSVENFASGAWQALGSAFKEGSSFIQKIENSAVNFAGSAQQDGTTGSDAPSFLETGKALTAKGMQVLESVGKETMELLISETGMGNEKMPDDTIIQADEDALNEEMTFDRCFYIYGGPEQLEELEALSNHHALLFNRKKGKLSPDQKSFFEGRLKVVRQILDLCNDESKLDKGKKIETGTEGSDSELKTLHDSSVSKAADMAAGFANALTGLAANEIIQRTASRLESLHSEGVHRLSEVCCFATSQLLILGKSIISDSNKEKKEEAEAEMKVEWPEDCLEKAKIIKTKTQLMNSSVESISSSFITGMSDVSAAYSAAIKGVSSESPREASRTKLIQEKANALSEHLRSDQTSALNKIQDAVQFLSLVILSTSVPSS